MRTRPTYVRKPPHMAAEALFDSLCLLEQNLGRLHALCTAIVRRHIDPPEWQEKFDGLVLECQCTVRLLLEQVDFYWPEPSQELRQHER